MKRNMDIVRAILIATEKPQPQIEGAFPIGEVVYHVRILDQAGLIIASHNVGSSITKIPPSYPLVDLTWSGHELLSAMRDDTLWAKAKSVVMAEGQSWTIDVLKAWLIDAAKQKLGLAAS